VLAGVWALVGVFLGRSYNRDKDTVAAARPVAEHG
jgi:hypothetical protein